MLQWLRSVHMLHEWKHTLHLNTDVQVSVNGFMYGRDPNQGPNNVDHIWPEYDLDQRQYLTQTPSMATYSETEDLLRRYRFWADEFYDHVIFKEDDIGPMGVLDYITSGISNYSLC